MRLLWVVLCAWFHSLCCGEQFLQDWPQGCEAKLPGEYEDASWVPMRKNRWNHCISKSGSLTLVQSLKANITQSSESWCFLYFSKGTPNKNISPGSPKRWRWMMWKNLCISWNFHPSFPFLGSSKLGHCQIRSTFQWYGTPFQCHPPIPPAS